MHAYEVRPRKDHRGVDLIADALPFGQLWYDGPDAAKWVSESVASSAETRTLFSFPMPA
jgi:hypothetical protein